MKILRYSFLTLFVVLFLSACGTETTSTALDALQQSGATIITYDSALGASVCSINGTGQPADNCYGDPDGLSWSFFTLKSDGTWKFAEVGVQDYIVQDGDVLAFVWTGSDADFNPLSEPPALTFSDVATDAGSASTSAENPGTQVGVIVSSEEGSVTSYVLTL